jgi:hypothetical protein
MKTRKSSYLWFLLVILIGTACSTADPDIRIVTVPNGGITPDAELDALGILHVAYFSEDNIYYAESADHGTTFTKPIQVNSESGTGQAGLFRGPDLALGADGRVHVAWYTNQYQRKRPQEEWGVRYAQLAPGATSFTPELNLNRTPSDNYSLAADGMGQVVVTWTSDALYTQSSDDGGQRFSDPMPITIADPCECCATQTYFSSTGDLYIGYREKANNQRDMHLLVQKKNEATFTKHLLSQTPWSIDACPMSGSSLTGGQNQLVAAWETKGAVYYGLANLEGELLTDEIQVSEHGKYPLVLPTASGYLVAWKEGATLVWQRFGPDGTQNGPTTRQENVGPHRPSGMTRQDGVVLLLP